MSGWRIGLAVLVGGGLVAVVATSQLRSSGSPVAEPQAAVSPSAPLAASIEPVAAPKDASATALAPAKALAPAAVLAVPAADPIDMEPQEQPAVQAATHSAATVVLPAQAHTGLQDGSRGDGADGTSAAAPASEPPQVKARPAGRSHSTARQRPVANPPQPASNWVAEAFGRS